MFMAYQIFPDDTIGLFRSRHDFDPSAIVHVRWNPFFHVYDVMQDSNVISRHDDYVSACVSALNYAKSA